MASPHAAQYRQLPVSHDYLTRQSTGAQALGLRQPTGMQSLQPRQSAGTQALFPNSTSTWCSPPSTLAKWLHAPSQGEPRRYAGDQHHDPIQIRHYTASDNRIESLPNPLLQASLPRAAPMDLPPPSPTLRKIALPAVSRTSTPIQSRFLDHCQREGSLGISVPLPPPAPKPFTPSALGIYTPEEPKLSSSHSVGSRRRRDHDEDAEVSPKGTKRTRHLPNAEMPPPPSEMFPRYDIDSVHWCPRDETPPFSSASSQARKSSQASSVISIEEEDYFSLQPRHMPNIQSELDAPPNFTLATPYEVRASRGSFSDVEAKPTKNSIISSHKEKEKEKEANANRNTFDGPEQQVRALSDAMKQFLTVGSMDDASITASDSSHTAMSPASISTVSVVPGSAQKSMPTHRNESDLLSSPLRQDFSLADVECAIVLQNIARDEHLIKVNKTNPGSASHIGKFRDREEEKLYDDTGVIPDKICSANPDGKGKKNGTLRSLQQGICQNCGTDETAAIMWRSDTVLARELGLKRRLCNRCGLYKQTNHIDRPILRPWILVNTGLSPSTGKSNHRDLPPVSPSREMDSKPLAGVMTPRYQDSTPRPRLLDDHSLYFNENSRMTSSLGPRPNILRGSTYSAVQQSGDSNWGMPL